jgi:hypothetical protein
MLWHNLTILKKWRDEEELTENGQSFQNIQIGRFVFILQRPLLGRPQSSSESGNRHEIRTL